jgi:hypothetical protein
VGFEAAAEGNRLTGFYGKNWAWANGLYALTRRRDTVRVGGPCHAPAIARGRGRTTGNPGPRRDVPARDDTEAGSIGRDRAARGFGDPVAAANVPFDLQLLAGKARPCYP